MANTRIGTVFSLSDRAKAMEYCIFYTLASKQTPEQLTLLSKMKSLFFPTTSSSSTTSSTTTTATTSTTATTNEEDWKNLPIGSEYLTALKLFLKDEVIVTPFIGQVVLEQVPGNQAVVVQNSTLSNVLTPELVKYIIEEFHIALIEYNLRMIAKYYTTIRMTRLSSLLSLSIDTLEHHLSDLSFRGDLSIKIDRPKGIVSFVVKKTSEQILSDWGNNLSTLLGLMETTGHLINRENMVYKI